MIGYGVFQETNMQHLTANLDHTAMQANVFHLTKLANIFYLVSALQAATILVAIASEKNFWRPKFWRKSPIGDQQINWESYFKNYQ